VELKETSKFLEPAPENDTMSLSSLLYFSNQLPLSLREIVSGNTLNI
jgi:hypothetical protein